MSYCPLNVSDVTIVVFPSRLDFCKEFDVDSISFFFRPIFGVEDINSCTQHDRIHRDINCSTLGVIGLAGV